MAFTLTLDDETLDALAKRARSAGLSIEDYLRTMVGLSPVQSTPRAVSGPGAVEDLNAALDDLFASEPSPIPATDLTYSRNQIYDDHD
jgi:hypothetical protein